MLVTVHGWYKSAVRSQAGTYTLRVFTQLRVAIESTPSVDIIACCQLGNTAHIERLHSARSDQTRYVAMIRP